ncbi:hypothetical protein TNCV_4642401 [Trichonephila clavipes]|nr:hypothetical protein TNCV_4642401 [Trichonephila clavipes]
MLSIVLNSENACLCVFLRDLALLSPLGLRGALDRGRHRSKGDDQRKTLLPSDKKFMVIHPGQTITDKIIGEFLSTAYFKAATVGNAVKWFKECRIEPHNPLMLIGNMTLLLQKLLTMLLLAMKQNNSANLKTLVVESQHINHPEEPILMANADFDAPKKPFSVFDFKLLPKTTQCDKKEKAKN